MEAVVVTGPDGVVKASIVNNVLVRFAVVEEGSPQADVALAAAHEAEHRRRLESGEAALDSSPLLRGLLLGSPEGRAVWDKRVAPSLSKIDLAALARSCRAGRAYRRQRVAAGEEDLLRFRARDSYGSVWELRLALMMGLGLSKLVVYDAADRGSAEVLDFLVFLLDKTVALDGLDKSTVWKNAAGAECDSLEKLEVLLQTFPGEWDEAACALAIQEHRVDALRWLHEHGAPWNEYTCLFAAQYGHLEALQYAVSNGCPWDRAMCLANASDDVAAWIEQHTA